MDDTVEPRSSDSSDNVCSTLVFKIESVRLNAKAVVTAIETSEIAKTRKMSFVPILRKDVVN